MKRRLEFLPELEFLTLARNLVSFFREGKMATVAAILAFVSVGLGIVR